MDQNSLLEELEEKIFGVMKDDKVSTIVLFGRPGIGKTRMARKMSLYAVKKKLFDIVLWVYLSVNYDERLLCENIARQLSLMVEIDDDNEEVEENNNAVEDEKSFTVETLPKKILERLEGKKLLLVLDDEGNKMHQDEINCLLHTTLFQHKNLVVKKKLITCINEDGRHKIMEGKVVVEMQPLGPQKSLFLLCQKLANPTIFQAPQVQKSIQEFMMRNNMSLTPAQVVMLAKLLSYHHQHHSSSWQNFQRLLEKVYDDDSSGYNLAQLLWTKYDKVPRGASLDFSWQGSHIFHEKHRLIHYSELISYWIMEGYLGQIDSIDVAYTKGHHILMELLNFGMLKKVDTNHLVMQRLQVPVVHCSGFCGTAYLGLAAVLADDDYNWEGLGKVILVDGVLRSLGSGNRKGKKQSTLLVDGNYLQREDLMDHLDSIQELQTLGLFHPRLKLLPLSTFQKLNILVLRDCDFLESIICTKQLETLSILEVSGASSLTTIPDDLFTNLKQLRSLNLSSLQVQVLPKSLFHLSELRWLILKGCSRLTKLQRLKRCSKLMVIDLNGASCLHSFPVKHLKALPKLQRLDLSGTKIKAMPIFYETGELKHLSLGRCKDMKRLPSIRSLTKLQVLDLSGAGIKEFHDESFQDNTNLKILDLSNTDISTLPSNIGTPREIYLKNCHKLEKFNCVETAEDLVVLDLSGSSSLIGIEAKFFEHLRSLRVLNLSKTNISVLPPCSNLSNLHQLVLSCCSNLEKLPPLETLCKLEVLDLSGCKSLTLIEDDSFEHMSQLQQLSLSETKVGNLPELKSLTNLEQLNLSGVHCLTKAGFLRDMSSLHTLDLSRTPLQELPSLSNLKTLCYLSLRGCGQLKTLPDLQLLTRLEVLDLSGTAVTSLSSLKDFSHLRELLLKNCSGLEGLKDFKMDDLSAAAIDDLPFGISQLTKLEHLVLPNMRINQGDVKEKTLDDLDEHQWAISDLRGDSKRFLMSSSGSKFLEGLVNDPSLWENYFKGFHFYVHPLEKETRTGGVYFHKNDLVYKDVYFLTKHFPRLKGHGGGLLEVRGFNSFPKGIDSVVSRAEHIISSENSYVKSLADIDDASSIKTTKGCWIERCQDMEHVITEIGGCKEMGGKGLETLWISNCLSLKNLQKPNLQHEEAFQNLKCLYLDCCPALSSIFPSSPWPQKLEVLHVKFCEKLSTLFGQDDDNDDDDTPRVRELLLWELPALKKMPPCVMPSLQTLEVGGCPWLEFLISSTTRPEQLEVLKVGNCERLESLVESITSGNMQLPNLHSLELRELPQLKIIDNIEWPASLKNAVINECPELRKLTPPVTV